MQRHPTDGDLGRLVVDAERRSASFAALGVVDRRPWWTRAPARIAGIATVTALGLASLVAWSWSPDPPAAEPSRGTAFPWHRTGSESPAVVAPAAAAERPATPSNCLPGAPCEASIAADAATAAAAAATAATAAVQAVGRADVGAAFGAPSEWTSWWAEQSGAPPQTPIAPGGGVGVDAAPRPSAATTDGGLPD